MIGFNIGMFDESVLNGTIVMILVTCTVSSIVTEQAAAKMKLQQMQSKGEGSVDKVARSRNIRSQSYNCRSSRGLGHAHAQPVCPFG